MYIENVFYIRICKCLSGKIARLMGLTYPEICLYIGDIYCDAISDAPIRPYGKGKCAHAKSYDINFVLHKVRVRTAGYFQQCFHII